MSEHSGAKVFSHFLSLLFAFDRENVFNVVEEKKFPTKILKIMRKILPQGAIIKIKIIFAMT